MFFQWSKKNFGQYIREPNTSIIAFIVYITLWWFREDIEGLVFVEREEY